MFGVADDLLGEVPKACLVLKEKSTAGASRGLEEELRQFLNGRLAPYKIPKYFEFRDALPKNEAGKILKTILRAEQRGD